MTGDLTHGSPTRVILRYSLPIILGNVFQQVYNAVDTVIVGRLVGYEALAGVGITTGLTFLVFGFVAGITSGLGILTAQFFGAGDIAGVRRSVGTSIIISAALSVVLTVLTASLAGPLLRLIGTGPEIYPHAYGYLFIVYAGVVSQVAYNLIACILRALGDSVTPLYFLIYSSVANVIFDLLFIGLFGWGARGAAVATVLAQIVSAVTCFIYAFRKYPELKISGDDFRTSWQFIWSHLRIGLPMALQFSITAIGIVLLQSALNRFPPTYIAGFTAASKIQHLGSLTAISFGVAIANYAGQNYGAGDIARVRKGVNVTLFLTLCVCAVASTLMVVFARPLTSLFINPETAGYIEDIYQSSHNYLVVSAIFFPFLFVLFIYRNALQGVGLTFWPLMAGVLELLLRSTLSFILPEKMGYPGIPLVDVSAWIGACIMLAISYYALMPRPGSPTHRPEAVKPKPV